MGLEIVQSLPMFDYPLSPPHPATNEIHIWFAFLDYPIAQLQILSHTLSADELLKAERFHFDRDRNRFITTHGILRTILGRYLSVEPSRLQFCCGKHGKPELAGILDNGTVRFSFSRSNTVALYAFTRHHEVGIDVEEIRELDDSDQIAETFFSRSEKKTLFRLSEGEKKEAFFSCWTRKEAFLKAIGEGLYHPLDRFDVSLAPGEPARLISVGGDSIEASQWTIQDLKPAAGFAAAIAVKGLGWRLRCWQWQH
jgi:4'-phosphopantetheinyl transferase